MYELVELREDDVFTNSKVIAEGTGNKHHSITAIIQKYERDFGDFGQVAFEMEPLPSGQKEKIYILNEEQATLLMTYLRNNEVVRQFKKNLVHQFYNMRKVLMEKQSQLWVETRQTNKANRLKETNIIKLLAEYAKEQGSTHSDKLYLVYTKLANRIVGNGRDAMTASELNNLTLVENIILRTIQIDMALGVHYKDIYKDCQERIEQFAKITYLVP